MKVSVSRLRGNNVLLKKLLQCGLIIENLCLVIAAKSCHSGDSMKMCLKLLLQFPQIQGGKTD